MKQWIGPGGDGMTGGHLVREALALGAVPLCSAHPEVPRLIQADVRGQDPRKFGHQWVSRGRPIWCVQTIEAAATEAEKEPAA